MPCNSNSIRNECRCRWPSVRNADKGTRACSHLARTAMHPLCLGAWVDSRAPSTASCCSGPSRWWPSRMRRRQHMRAPNAWPPWLPPRRRLHAQCHPPQLLQARCGGRHMLLTPQQQRWRRRAPPALRCVRHLRPQLALRDLQLSLLLQLNRLCQLQQRPPGLPSLWQAPLPLRWLSRAAACQRDQAAANTPNTPHGPRCSPTRTCRRAGLLLLRVTSSVRLRPLPLPLLQRPLRMTTRPTGAGRSPRPAAAAAAVAAVAAAGPTVPIWSMTSRLAFLAPRRASTKPKCSRPT